MEIARRRLASNEVDHELIWLIVSVTALALAASWRWIGLPWPSCLFHDLTGLPCVTCGATRSATAFFHGHFLSALKWNPFIFATLCGLFLFNVYAFAALVLRTPRLRFYGFSRVEVLWLRSAVIVLLLTNWIYLLINRQAF